ncbi:hypothetical protein NV379_03945 [Paenibacillus sp. N1-5-1-14]|uniref:hypothetical protein n=1 Tax=Paenibacillus radicibacter TaxID=2972488 RepID=UPI002159A826|nr:hypothetical protein [Paenibacillus radicibacter]MCR8641803.1 hypothetical protein [Paenibacillus radicibacter]
MSEVLYFETPSDFQKWLSANHKEKLEQWVGSNGLAFTKRIQVNKASRGRNR